MRDIDWRTLTILQDDLVKLEESRKKQRQNYHKLLYKNDLQKMINQKRNYQKIIKQDEKRTYNEAYKSLDHNHQQNKSKRFYTIVKQNSDYNFMTSINRKSRQLNEIHEDKQNHRDRFRRVETEELGERQKESIQKEKKRKELAQFYQSQINNTTSKKYLQKLQNKRFEELAREVQLQKQKERLNNLNKIRFGYYQNPETFSSIKNIYNEAQQQKQNLLKKIQTSKSQNDRQKSRQKIQQQINQTSKFNRNCFIQKQVKKQQNLLKTIEDDNNKIISIQQQISEQNELQSKKRKMNKLNLKAELESQIHETFENKVKWKKMNQNELKMNQPYTNIVQPVSIPGLYKDYKDIKRQQIIQKFLVNQKYSMPTPFSSKILSK